jgi:NAD(P)-dependent dehydrogenase (short-subunit alcohol dehydrogenase family)
MSIAQNSKVLVVGGSSGIGFATAALAAKEGGDVMIVSRSPDRLAKAAKTLPANVASKSLDVTDAAAVERFFENGQEWDHVVVAGSATNVGPVRGFALEEAHAAMSSKFWGAYHVARYAPIRAGGSLTFVSGVYSVRPSKQAVLQGAINAALEALGRGLAVELAPVRVNTVSPSLTVTPLWDRLEAPVRDKMFKDKAAQLPAGRVGQAEDIASAILFLATNPFATGTTLLIDGGDALV